MLEICKSLWKFPCEKLGTVVTFLVKNSVTTSKIPFLCNAWLRSNCIQIGRYFCLLMETVLLFLNVLEPCKRWIFQLKVHIGTWYLHLHCRMLSAARYTNIQFLNLTCKPWPFDVWNNTVSLSNKLFSTTVNFACSLNSWTL